MRSKKENAAIVGVGAVACAACCAGPIIGFIGALGLLAGVALFGTVGVAVAAIVLLIVVRRRRRRGDACTTAANAPVAIEITPVRHGQSEDSDFQHAPEPGLRGGDVQQRGRLGK